MGRCLARMGVAARDLDDVGQAVLWGIHRGLARFDPSLSASAKTALRGWIHGICERQAAGHRRGEAKRAAGRADLRAAWRRLRAAARA